MVFNTQTACVSARFNSRRRIPHSRTSMIRKWVSVLPQSGPVGLKVWFGGKYTPTVWTIGQDGLVGLPPSEREDLHEHLDEEDEAEDQIERVQEAWSPQFHGTFGEYSRNIQFSGNIKCDFFLSLYYFHVESICLSCNLWFIIPLLLLSLWLLLLSLLSIIMTRTLTCVAGRLVVVGQHHEHCVQDDAHHNEGVEGRGGDDGVEEASHARDTPMALRIRSG